MATPSTPVWTRAYLKNIGAQDNEIDYQNGAVTYKNKPFQYTQPAADGKAYGTQQGLDAAYKLYQGNDALDQYKTNISKAPTPFTYDANSIKSDPLYTSGLQSLQNDAQTATNQSLVNLGRRGIGNSQSAVTSANAQQQNVVNQANTKLAPQVIAQKYQEYLNANAQQDKQNQNLLGYATTQLGAAQQDFNNNRLVNSDERQAGLDARQVQMDHISLADQLGKEYGVHVDPKDDPALAYEQVKGLKTVAQQKQEADSQKGIYDNALKQFETIGTATPEIAKILGIPEGTTTQQAKNQNAAQGTNSFNAQTSRYTAEQNAANQAFDNKITSARYNLDKLKSGEQKDEAISKLLDSSPLIQKRVDEDGNVIGTTVAEADRPLMAQYIANLGMEPAEAKKWFIRYGLWSDSGN